MPCAWLSVCRMRQRLGLLVLSLAVIGVVTQSCSSSDGSDAGSVPKAGSAGNAGSGGSSGAIDAGAGGTSAVPSAGSAGEAGSSGTSAGAGGMSGSSDAAGAGGAFIGVAETSCVENADCLPVCEHYGWPKAHCFGYCYCEAENGMPTCKAGTTEGCPSGTQCRGGSGCRPYGTGTDDVVCALGDECAVGYECIRYGNPLPNGNSSACRHLCSKDQPLPADCYSCENGDYCDPHPAGGASGVN